MKFHNEVQCLVGDRAGPGMWYCACVKLFVAARQQLQGGKIYFSPWFQRSIRDCFCLFWSHGEKNNGEGRSQWQREGERQGEIL